MNASALSPHRVTRKRLVLLGWKISWIWVLGVLVVGFWLLMAVFGNMLSPYGNGQIVARDSFAPMSAAFPFGTDYLGRDMFSRILLAARYTVGMSVAAALISSLVGATLGILAAVSGGVVDAVLSRIADAIIAVPNTMFALVVVAALGSSIPVLVLTMAAMYAPGTLRITRALALNVSKLDFVQVARARGEGTLYIVWREILPNIVLPIMTDFGLRFVFIVLVLSGLSFLGFGVQPPAADWGALVRENILGLSFGAPAVIFPAIAIATLTIGMNLVLDNLPTRLHED
ncbi:ABC transporter permease [Salipiger abyssi]|uniref:ABC transporter permease n=1 Tax=Salipiger abyssi TaxID=1250539 RepID=UPI0040582C00